MGGDLLVESKKNLGSRFYFTLGFDFTEVKTETKDKDFLNNALHNKNLFKGLTFLVVDDLEFNVEIAANLLKGWGATVLKAGNGKEAIEIISKNPHTNVILMDLRMPEMDGLEATRILRKEHHFNRIILGLTGEVLKERIDECLEAGMDGHISKPFKKIEFLKAILKFVTTEINN